MDNLFKVKAAFSAFAAALSAWLGNLYAPVVILVLFNIADYITGIYASHCRGEAVSSHRGFRGIAKKICMWLLVAVAIGMDRLILAATEIIGINSPLRFYIACLAAVWLICNEVISILENVADIGVAPPPFLRPVIEWLRVKTEETASTSEDKSDE